MEGRSGGGRGSRSGGNGHASQTSRGAQAYAQLKADILDGVLQPGDPLGEVEFASRLGVSRTPVREALQRLTIEGLVSWIPGRGAFVSALSVPDIVELYQYREALERHTARLAAMSPSHASITPFIRRFEECRPHLTEADLPAYYRLSEAFDAAVADLAINGRMRASLVEVWAQSARIRRLANRNLARIAQSVDEHLEIAAAIAAGDPDGAEAAAGRHISNSLRNVIDSLAGMTTRR